MNRLEVCTNIALITVSSIAGYVLLDRHLAERRGASPQHASAIGKQIPDAGLGGAVAPANVFVAFSTNCHFCRESVDFYRGLTKDPQRIRGKVRVTFISMQPGNEVKKYLTDNGVEPDAVITVPVGLSISGTPTILLTGSDGVVKSQFAGKLSTSREKEFIEAVQTLCQGCGFGGTL